MLPDADGVAKSEHCSVGGFSSILLASPCKEDRLRVVRPCVLALVAGLLRLLVVALPQGCFLLESGSGY